MRISSITKNAGKACNNRLYRHIRTFEKIVKNYFVIFTHTTLLLLLTPSSQHASPDIVSEFTFLSHPLFIFRISPDTTTAYGILSVRCRNTGLSRPVSYSFVSVNSNGYFTSSSALHSRSRASHGSYGCFSSAIRSRPCFFR